MHKCIYTDRIELDDGKITRIVHAYYKSKKYENEMDVFKSDENGINYSRHIYYQPIAGYGVVFKDEYISSSYYYYQSYISEYENYSLTENNGAKIYPLYCNNDASNKDLEIITDKYSDFKYVLKKWKCRKINRILECLKIWKKHKEIEILLAYGFEKIAFTEKFYNLKDRKKKEVIAYLKEYREEVKEHDMSLNDVFTSLKYGYKPHELNTVKSCRKNKLTEKETLYVLTRLNGKNIVFYRNYLDNLKLLGKNLDDEYWHYPSDFSERQEKILEEKDNYYRNLEENKKRLYREKVNKFIGMNEIVDGYNIFVPQSIEDIKIQAEVLHQCLMTGDYSQKVINDECVLVFIRRNNIPIGTVQLNENDRIYQFYLDEYDRKNMYPDEELKNTFNKWLNGKSLMKLCA